MAAIQLIPPDYHSTANCLHDKVILVTGASDGIGRAVALSCAAHGANVVLLGKSSEKLGAVYDEIEAAGCPPASLCPFDLNNTSTQAYAEVAKGLQEHYGKLDGLIHCAGMLGSKNSIESYKAEQWLKVMQVNVNAAFLLTQALMPLLKQAPMASIIFSSSAVGRKARAHWGAYAVSKFAIEGLMETLADEQDGTSKVRVNCINPGATATKMRAAAYPAEDPATLKTPEQVTTPYLYLMDPVSQNVNGQTFDAQAT